MNICILKGFGVTLKQTIKNKEMKGTRPLGSLLLHSSSFQTENFPNLLPPPRGHWSHTQALSPIAQLQAPHKL